MARQHSVHANSRLGAFEGCHEADPVRTIDPEILVSATFGGIRAPDCEEGEWRATDESRFVELKGFGPAPCVAPVTSVSWVGLHSAKRRTERLSPEAPGLADALRGSPLCNSSVSAPVSQGFMSLVLWLRIQRRNTLYAPTGRMPVVRSIDFAIFSPPTPDGSIGFA